MEFCPKGPVGITLHSVGKRMGCPDPASRGALAPKARETETGNPYRGTWSPNLRVSTPHPGLRPACLSRSLSVCLLFALVEVYTDPAHIRGGGGLHLVWTLRGMGARGNMVRGPGERAGGGR